MTRTLFALLLAAFSMPSFAQTATPTPAAPAASAATTAAPASGGRKKRVAVFDFDYATVQTASAAAFGTNVDVGKGISDLLVQVSGAGRHLFGDRAQGAWTRSLPSRISPTAIAPIPTRRPRSGKILGVDAIIVGSVTQFGNDNKNTKVGGGGGGLGRIRPGRLRPQEEQGGRAGGRPHREHRYRRDHGRGRRQRRVIAREHLAAGRRRRLAWLGRRRGRLRQQRLPADHPG